MLKNRVISMFYELKDMTSGDILESNFEANPITFITGFNQIIQKLEDEVLNLKSGEEKVIKIEPNEGIGEYDASKIESIPKEQFAGIDLKEGMELFGEAESGETTRVIIKAIGEDEVMVDFNHPYAGKTLEFNVKVMENREANDDEIAMQRAEGVQTCGCGSSSNGGCCGEHHHGDDECCGRHH